MKELPDGWGWKRLGEVCEKPEYGYTTSAKIEGSGPKFLRTTDITKGTFDWSNVPYCEKIPDDEEKYQLREGDILFSRAGSVGASFIVKNPPRAVFASYLIRFQPKEQLDPDFANFILKSDIFFKQLGGLTSGTTLQGVNAQNLARIKIPLPPLPIQRQIVAVLEKGEAVKRQRQEADILTRALLQSAFLEMFGDPVKNEMGWEVKQLDEVCPLIRDGEHRTPTYIDEGIPFITAKNLVGNGINFENTDKISPKEHIEFSKRAKPEMGDLLMTKDGTIGVTQVIKEDIEFSIYVSVVLLKLNHEIIHPDFLHYLLSTDDIQNEIRKRTKGIAIRHIHLVDLRSLKIPLPPLALQQQFAHIVESVERIRDQQVASGRQIEGLCEGLMQRAFAGELVG